MTDTITIIGNVATEPRHLLTAAGLSMTTFRLASNLRRFDRKLGTWVDAGTNWYSVSAYRDLADTVAESIKRSDPVIVVGKLRIRDWDSGAKSGTNIDLDAEAIGHNLTRGTTVFTRLVRSTSVPDFEENHAPDFEGGDFSELSGSEDPLGADTGASTDSGDSAESSTERSELSVPF